MVDGLPSRRTGGERLELVQGTLDMLVLQTLVWGRAHGHAIAKALAQKTIGPGFVRALATKPASRVACAVLGAVVHQQQLTHYRSTPSGPPS